ncbi:hypothetical protein TNCV_4221161 [Trichonephila clavipes]|nr:hypothetical protein TNCV_4221161 [Trichonephila clavipes]
MLKIDWTDLLPDTINREWRQFVESLQVVNDININRCIVVEQPEVIELHGFSDACQSAYGAVVYCKSITSDGKMLVHLIASKSRVAPTKQTTIPRLELCAAVLLAKLVHRVKQALKLNDCYNQEMTSSEQWRYVATEDNPADFVSRGMDSLKLKTCRSITSIVEPDLTNLNENRLDNWQKITKIIQLIWKRWSVDYLNSLQQRNKWHFEKKNAKIGDMVIIKEDNLPSCQWSLGRINNIYPGKDSKVRVVEVKTTRDDDFSKEQRRCAAFISRRVSVSGESRTSFPEDTSMPYYLEFNPNPLDYRPRVITNILARPSYGISYREVSVSTAEHVSAGKGVNIDTSDEDIALLDEENDAHVEKYIRCSGSGIY